MPDPTPLPFDDLTQLRPGDRVRHRSAAGHAVEVTVRTRPVRGAGGVWIVGFEEMAGNFALADVTGLVSAVHPRGPS